MIGLLRLKTVGFGFLAKLNANKGYIYVKISNLHLLGLKAI